jgi:hypothetical protein
MHEIAPGLWHWMSRHPHIDSDVSSYYLADARVALDPLLPSQGIEWFTGDVQPPEHVLLTNRNHDRDAWKLQEAFGTAVHVVANGVHELDGRGEVTPFAFGDELPGGIVAHEVGAICPDETALHIPGHGALAVADGIVRWPGTVGLTFVPDSLMDEPEQTKRGLRDAYRRLLELDFERLLLAHGEPVTSDAKQALADFVDG